MVNENNGGGYGWGGDWSAWIIIFLIFAICGWGGNGGGFGGNRGGGVTDGYVLASDFANIERKIDGVNNGLCDGFYAMNTGMLNGFSGVNQNIMQTGFGLQTQLADCCCKTQSGIERVNTNMAMSTGDIKAAIKDCCCESEKTAMQSRFDAQTYNCNTLQAIDKLGDRIIDYMAQDKAQTLRDENQALRLAASQSAQNQYIINQLRPMPIPAYPSCNPWAASYGFQNTCNGGF